MEAIVVLDGRRQWAERIRACWQKTVENVLEIGQLLIDAKEALPHGDFEAMVRDDLGWAPGTARKLMSVRKHPVLSNRSHVNELPSAWGTLYELSRLPAETLEDALESGLITADMQRKDVAALRAEVLSEPIDVCPSITCTVKDLDELIRRGYKFGTVYADPPWQYGNQGTRAATSNHYETMSIDEIAALPIEKLSAEKSHLHLWTTNAFIREGLELIDSWGFEYKSVFVWTKPEMGIGNYWRVSHEFMLLGVRGGCHFQDHSQPSWKSITRAGGHSSKPQPIRELVEKVSPNPRLELFGREAIEGWVVWGNEIERNLFAQGIEELCQ